LVDTRWLTCVLEARWRAASPPNRATEPHPRADPAPGSHPLSARGLSFRPTQGTGTVWLTRVLKCQPIRALARGCANRAGGALRVASASARGASCLGAPLNRRPRLLRARMEGSVERLPSGPACSSSFPARKRGVLAPGRPPSGSGPSLQLESTRKAYLHPPRARLVPLRARSRLPPPRSPLCKPRGIPLP
jgi:hypothetical protein